VWRPGSQRLLQLVELRQEAAHPHVGVDALVETTAVRRLPVGYDLDPAKALVREAHAQLGGLGHDGGFGVVVLQDFLHADAGYLLIGGGYDQDVACQLYTGVAQRLGRADARREPALHVVRAAAMEPPVADGRAEGVDHVSHAHRVEVAIQHQALAAGAPRQAAHGVVTSIPSCSRACPTYAPASRSLVEPSENAGLTELMRTRSASVVVT
jgi:hypothetical protein